MAIVRPFRALRYNDARYPDLTALLAPPYDIINAAEQRVLYERHTENVIRLEYGLQSAQDTAADTRYSRARATLDAWCAAQTLVLEAAPSFYPHRQGFSWNEEYFYRQGVFAAVQLEAFDAGDVLPHEWTLTGPKEDRLQLMHACQASFSPIFGLYDGADSEMGALLRRASTGVPLATAAGDGFDETLWRCTDPALNTAIAAALRQRKILIADGHHRYETMLAVRDLLRAEYPNAPANAGFNYAFMLLVDLRDPGLLVLPTHRLLLLTPEMQAACSRVLGAHFQRQPLRELRPAQVSEILARQGDAHAFIWYAEHTSTLLTSAKATRNGLPVLDVQVLQEQLIAPLLEVDPVAEGTVERNVRYTHDIADAMAAVDRGEAQAALFLRATPVPDVLTLAAAGIRLPQKSTYFYPKVPTGLVMYSLRPEVTVG